MKNLILILLAIVLLSSCGDRKPPVDLGQKTTTDVVRIPYTEKNGAMHITIKINDVPMDATYDTGFNGGIHMSLLELQTLIKNGEFSEADVIGVSTSQIADGSIVENGHIMLRKVEVGGSEQTNVEATVSPNASAPVLFGTGMHFGEYTHMEIDKEKKEIIFKRK